VIRFLFLEINKAFVGTFMDFLTIKKSERDFFAAGVRRILRSLFPLPITDKISELTCSTFKLASSEILSAQFKKIVIIQ